MVGYIAQCPKCKTIRVSYTKDIEYARFRCLSCGKYKPIMSRKTRNFTIKIFKVSQDYVYLAELCRQIKKEIHKKTIVTK